MELKNILDELQTRFGFESLHPDEHGVYSMLVNKKFKLHLAETSEHDAFFMYSDIITVNPDAAFKLHVFEKTLSANLFGKETHDAYFAYDSQRSVILLTKRFDIRVTDYSRFFEEFRNFINSLSYWDQIVNEGLMEPLSVKKQKSNFIDTRKIV